MPKGPQIKDISGLRFGRLVVSSTWTMTKEGRYHQARWDCVCDCGKSVQVRGHCLRKGLTTSCGCARRDWLQQECAKREGKVGQVTNGFFSRVRNSAKSRSLALGITKSDVNDLMDKQKSRCALSGLPIHLVHKQYKGVNPTGSVDRIDSALGYITGNVQVVHKDLNLMKSDLCEDTFKAYCVLVSNKWVADLLAQTKTA